ncbi:hypothetical protein Scep_021322 [Stephania cephalantha]|uniref:WDR11 first beta-propeller domain-containing protein n=1 Tax=Stephania cephalantha TaxID=152367 RepID=A0AAP0F8A6_9MAGN
MPPSRYPHRIYDWGDHWSLSTSRSRCFLRYDASLEFLSYLCHDPFDSHRLCAFILFVKLVGDNEEEVVVNEVQIPMTRRGVHRVAEVGEGEGEPHWCCGGTDDGGIPELCCEVLLFGAVEACGGGGVFKGALWV